MRADLLVTDAQRRSQLSGGGDLAPPWSRHRGQADHGSPRTSAATAKTKANQPRPKRRPATAVASNNRAQPLQLGSAGRLVPGQGNSRGDRRRISGVIGVGIGASIQARRTRMQTARQACFSVANSRGVASLGHWLISSMTSGPTLVYPGRDVHLVSHPTPSPRALPGP